MRGATQREPKRSDTKRLTPKVVERIKAAEENKQKLKEAQLFIAEHDLRSMLRSRDGEMDDDGKITRERRASRQIADSTRVGPSVSHRVNSRKECGALLLSSNEKPEYQAMRDK